MALLSEVTDVVTFLVDANLSYPPKDIVATARAWAVMLKDIPAATLKQAAEDYTMTGKDFPKLAELRNAAYQVKVHNNTTAAVNHFESVEQPITWTTTQAWPPEERRAENEYWKEHPLQYWAMVEAETLGLDKNKVYAEWKAAGIKTYGDIDAWRERQTCTA